MNSSLTGAFLKIPRKWSWSITPDLASLESVPTNPGDILFRTEYAYVRWCNRKQSRGVPKIWVRVDDTDCPYVNLGRCTAISTRINSSEWVRYELAVCIAIGRTVRANGPYTCGSNPELTIFRKKIKRYLEPDELVLAGSGHPDARVLCRLEMRVPAHLASTELFAPGMRLSFPDSRTSVF